MIHGEPGQEDGRCAGLFSNGRGMIQTVTGVPETSQAILQSVHGWLRLARAAFSFATPCLIGANSRRSENHPAAREPASTTRASSRSETENQRRLGAVLIPAILPAQRRECPMPAADAMATRDPMCCETL